MAESSNDVSRMTPPPQPNPKWLSQVMIQVELFLPPQPNPKWLSQVMM